MILADKLIRLRKKNGWSQEELAEKMNALIEKLNASFTEAVAKITCI